MRRLKPVTTGHWYRAYERRPGDSWPQTVIKETRVSVLYASANGPYPDLAEDVWTVERDASRYTGPRPVVAHPPCGPWSRLHAFCTKDDPELAPIAVEQVRMWGGVLEHPANSRLWKHMGLPMPDTMFPDAAGGMTFRVDQGNFGHPAPKGTWLYCVGCRPTFTARPSNNLGRVANMHSGVRHLTPVPFARELLNLAASVEPRCPGNSNNPDKVSYVRLSDQKTTSTNDAD